MVDYRDEQHMSELLRCVSDATRRSLLTKLCQEGPCRVTDLAAHYDMSLNAISKHIKVLESCSLVSRTTEGRMHWIRADLAEVQRIEDWFGELKSIWEQRLDALTDILQEEK